MSGLAHQQAAELLAALAKSAAAQGAIEALKGETERLRQIAREAVQQYAEAHPRPSHVTGNQAAKMLGVSAQTITRMSARGAMPRDKTGLIPIAAVDEILRVKK